MRCIIIALVDNLKGSSIFNVKFWIVVLVQLEHGTSRSSWIKMNSGQTGYYRINYDAVNWCKLGHQLATDHTVTVAK